MGFVHPQHDGLINELDVERDERGNVKAPESTYKTSIPKIFAAGDMRRGQSLVVWAISEGRECAKSVDEYLTGKASALESKDKSAVMVG
jgi:glutamate synthase (NADPH/NADH) small chain